MLVGRDKDGCWKTLKRAIVGCILGTAVGGALGENINKCLSAIESPEAELRNLIDQLISNVM